jgi:hypothetical protein
MVFNLPLLYNTLRLVAAGPARPESANLLGFPLQGLEDSS